jgi:A/G-specific adenine glycosylase
MALITTSQFKTAIRHYYRTHGRHDLPWRKTRDPYAILVSEIMLQQTQVARVEGFYQKFLEKFPDFKKLAQANVADVLSAWQGLGYNRRALALKKTAEVVIKEYGGVLPADRAALERLPGIGKGTSGSLMAFAFNKPEIFIETNIRRVFIHSFFPNVRKTVTDVAIERYIERTIDQKHPREWYWALMDYGAAMGAKKNGKGVSKNPNKKSAHYRKQSAFKGSNREARGKILRYLLAQMKEKKSEGKKAASTLKELKTITNIDNEHLKKILSRLIKEGFIIREESRFRINSSRNR